MSDAVVNGLAGACGGIIAQILTYPLQTVNTRQQVRRKLLRCSDGQHHAHEEQGQKLPYQHQGEGEQETEQGLAHESEQRARSPNEGPCAGGSLSTRTNELPGQEQKDNCTSSTGRDTGSLSSRSSGDLHGGGQAGMADTAREIWGIVRTEGLGGLYRGLEPSLVGTACSQGVYYYFYQTFRSQVELHAQQRKAAGTGRGEVSMVESLVVAALAGCVNVLLTNPIWVVVTRMQTQCNDHPATAITLKPTEEAPVPKPPMVTPTQGTCAGETASNDAGSVAVARCSPPTARGNGDEASSLPRPAAAAAAAAAPRRPQKLGALATTWGLFEEAGILGFWKGVVPTLVMVSNPAIQFTIYETLMARLTASRPKALGGAKSASAWEIFAIGAVAKIGATLLTYPLLVVKSRLQATITDPASRYTGTVDALMRIVLEEGLMGLYKGMQTKIVQSVFAASVLFLTKEELVKLVRFVVERKEREQRQSTSIQGNGPLSTSASASKSMSSLASK